MKKDYYDPLRKVIEEPLSVFMGIHKEIRNHVYY